MKKLASIITMFLLFVLTTVLAQQPPVTRSFRLDEHSVVKDSTGKIYSFTAWSKLMATRQYTIQPENFEAAVPIFIIMKRSQAEQHQVAMIKQMSAKGAGAIQSQARTKEPAKFIPPGENSIVKDSSNIIYPYAAWQNMMSTGNYTMRVAFAGPDSGIYTIIKRSPQEKDAMAARMAKPEPSDRFKIGDDFGSFKAKDINGEKLDLKAMTGKVLVVNFWFIGCPPCRAEIPDLNEIADHYKDNKDVVFIAVCLDEAFDIKEYTKLHPFNYHIVDGGRFIAEKYGVRLYPTNVVVDKDRKVVFSSVSNQFTNPYWIKKTVDAALAAPITTTAAK
ncbi:TlpA family protein disulfide reductase [Mucilaginibacter agri]|uniref:Redoxin domain-containing protein n=1 Tax=Mucilaginibacter agri TaxID=2695265 RepID=A0A965ZDB1_9SPHI|nr:TlpA disulfide reductase family protein [Mucilaginibacter agri]NCD68173.1 redoxin domain-containing protein [Mucilaginibacter agri]